MQRIPVNPALPMLALLPFSATVAKSDKKAEASESKEREYKEEESKDGDAKVKTLLSPVKDWTVSNASRVKLISAISNA